MKTHSRLERIDGEEFYSHTESRFAKSSDLISHQVNSSHLHHRFSCIKMTLVAQSQSTEPTNSRIGLPDKRL